MYWFSGFLKGNPGFGIPGQPGPKGDSGERVSVYDLKVKNCEILLQFKIAAFYFNVF